MAGALLVGSVIGSPLAQALTASLVQIEGGHSTNVAAVSSTGKLSVNAGLTTTPDRQVKTALASPEDSVDILVIQTANPCSPGAGGYTIPSGKALIITGATFLNVNTGVSGAGHSLILWARPAKGSCMSSAAAMSAVSEDFVTQHQDFSPGIAVPAGDVLALQGGDDSGSVFVYGYLVPATAVPAGILSNARPPLGLIPHKPTH